MKRIIGVHLYTELTLGVILLIYSVLFKLNNIESLVNFIGRGISVIFATASFLVVYRNFSREIDNRVKMMGICGMIISILMTTHYAHMLRTPKVYGFFEIEKILYSILVVVFLLVCTKSDEDEMVSNMKILLSVSTFTLVGYILVDVFKISATGSLWFVILQLVIFLILSMVIILRWIALKSKFELLNLKEDMNICSSLYLCGILVCCTMIVEIFIKSYILTILRLLIQTVICLDVFNYIQKKVFINKANVMHSVLSKNQKCDNEGYFIQDILFSSAVEMNSRINKMNNIVGEISYKLKQTGDEGDLLYVRKIQKNCKILEKLGSNIVELNTNIDVNYKVHFERCDIISFIKESVDALIPYFKCKDIELEYDIKDKDIYCDFGIQELERILINIISNSIKYTKPGGKVIIGVNKDDSNVYIQIKDTGIGIKSDDIKDIFLRFSRHSINGEKEQEGSGLGLAIVKNLVELHNGQIEIMSSLGSGTTVHIKLPLNQ